MIDESVGGNPEILRELVSYRMPFGKYKDQMIRQLPMSYLEWFMQKGFPSGKLGMLLQTMYEIKLNGIDYLIDELAQREKGQLHKNNKNFKQ